MVNGRVVPSAVTRIVGIDESIDYGYQVVGHIMGNGLAGE